MDEKSAHEAYRVRQYASPHPAIEALNSICGPAGGLELVGTEPDKDRVIVHFDVDAFYAQVSSAELGIGQI
jgi:hypothetical protein